MVVKQSYHISVKSRLLLAKGLSIYNNAALLNSVNYTEKNAQGKIQGLSKLLKYLVTKLTFNLRRNHHVECKSQPAH